jgi:predicted ATP-dependent serine protease
MKDRVTLSPEVVTCKGCGVKALCWGGRCVECLRDAFEQINAAPPEHQAITIEAVPTPPTDEEYYVLLESLSTYTTHNPRCTGWGDFQNLHAQCNCGLSGLRKQAETILKERSWKA